MELDLPVEVTLTESHCAVSIR